MTVKLKPITETSWLVIADDTRVGLLTETRNQYLLIMRGEKQRFLDRKEVVSYFKEDVFNIAADSVEDGEEERSFYISGYPVNFMNPIESSMTTTNLPLFRKKESSNVYYCAGYYCIKFSDTWLQAYCPKLSTVQSYEYIGPFKSTIDLQVALKKARKTSLSNEI